MILGLILILKVILTCRAIWIALISVKNLQAMQGACGVGRVFADC